MARHSKFIILYLVKRVKIVNFPPPKELFQGRIGICFMLQLTIFSARRFLTNEGTSLDNLIKYGVNEHFLAEAKHYPSLHLARVLSQSRGLYKIATEDGEVFAEISGKFRHEACYLQDYPAVGDFVMIESTDVDSGNAIIHHVLTRKSMFSRAAVGVDNEIQIIASNIDIVFICMSLNKDYNLGRLERYLSVAWSSQAVPVVVLTKSDLCKDLSATLEEIRTIALGVDIIVTSSFDQESCDKLFSYLKQGVSASFIGSSGVGKSTLINQLARKELAATSAISEDDKGRHTTVKRELYVLPQGGIVIDTPGIREVGAESADLSKSFADVDELVSNCKFNDCAHADEPGCAIRHALKTGALDERRFRNYQKLKREVKYDGLSAKQIETAKTNNMFGSKIEMKKFKQGNKRK